MKQSHEHPTQDLEWLLLIGMALTFLIFLLELFGGLWSHSLALMADAWHIFIDIWSMVISYLAILLAQRPANERRTFGLHRMEVFAAFLNGLCVFLISVGMLWAAWNRFQYPTQVHTRSLMAVASLGLVLNLIVAGLFFESSRSDLNIHGVFLHVLGDALNTLAVVLAAGLIYFTHSPRIDPIVCALIAGIVLWGSGRLLRDAVNTLLEGVPLGMNVNDVEQSILSVDGVESMHDLHVWSICSHLKSLSGHVYVGDSQLANPSPVLDAIRQRMKDRFGISHTTIQVESKSWPNREGIS